MELPINDKELNTIVSALRLGGDAALYQKLNTIKEIRDANPGGPYKKIAREEFGFVIVMDFLKEIVKEIGDDYTKLARDIDDSEKYVDTGSYIFNGLVSGSIFGGVSGNKITAIAGESSTGKTFFSLAVVKNFLDANPDGYCYILILKRLLTSLLSQVGVLT